MGLVISNNVNVFAVTGFNSKSKILSGLQLIKLSNRAIEIFNEEAGKRSLLGRVKLVIEPVLRAVDSWDAVNAISTGFGTDSAGTALRPENFAVGSVLYETDVETAKSRGFETVVSPMTYFNVLQAAAEARINAIPAISDLSDADKLERQARRFDSNPSIVKVFPFDANGAKGLVDALGGPFSREIQIREVSLVADDRSTRDTPTKFWTALLKADKGAQIRIGKLVGANGLGSLRVLRESVERFKTGVSTPVVTGGIKADAESISAIVKDGVRNIGLSALITDEVQQAASGQTPNYDIFRANVGKVLDGIKSGLEQGS
jgi:2-keto-3-deoxy-6-phosphogluconate aldolase